MRHALIPLISLADDLDKSVSGDSMSDDLVSDDPVSDDPMSDDPVSDVFWGTQTTISELILRCGSFATCREVVGPESFKQMEATWPDLGWMHRTIGPEEGSDAATCRSSERFSSVRPHPDRRGALYI